jgi:F-type H+-transporting ATPase subunit epsilon
MAVQNTFRLVVASVGTTHFDGAAVSATMPGEGGVFELLPNHEPFVTSLVQGTILIKETEGVEKKFPIESGVAECSGGRAVVLL